MAYKYNVRLHYRFMSYRPVQLAVLHSNAQWVYSQYGVQLEAVSFGALDNYEGVFDTNIELPKRPPLEAWPPYRWLMAHIGPVKGIPVVFAPGLIQGAKALNLPSADGQRIAILLSSETSRWTLAHELGHALANVDDEGKRGELQNHVMHPTMDMQVPPLSAPIFTDEQVQRIYRSPFCAPI